MKLRCAYTLESLSVCILSMTVAFGRSDGMELKANSHDPGTPLIHYWSTTVGAGRPNEGLRSSWQEQLAKATSAAGFRYVRFHRLFHDDMFVYP